MVQKILICGFPHCGTSILKSIIGHIEEVEEIKDECDIIKKDTIKKYILCKSPFTNNNYFSDKYKDYIKIFIIRNPLFVFSSLNKRFEYNIPENHSINNYIETIKKFININNNNIKKNIYTIKYEELFKNNFNELKKILDDIGMKYDDNIFDNTKYRNIICTNTNLVKEKPKNTEHALYRTWQINQPFVLNNNVSNIDLSEEQKKVIINNNYILKLYPDIKKII
jgi:hypothetical protein